MEKKLRQQRPTIFAEELEFPSNMLVEVTNACNHACLFCAHSKMQRKIKLMDFEFFKSIARQAFDGGVREIGFYMTGEPLVHTRLKDFVAYVKKLGFTYIYITTNGALAKIETMRSLIESGVNSIKFSINAGTRETYKLIHGKDDFETVIANLKAVSEYVRSNKLEVGLFVTCIACQQNNAELETLFNLVRPYVDDVTAPKAYNQGGNMYEINEATILDKNYKPMKTPCAMIFNRIHVTCEGYLNACCVDFENDLAIADLNSVSLAEAWNSDKMKRLRRMHLNNELPKNLMCYNCVNNTNEQVESFK